MLGTRERSPTPILQYRLVTWAPPFSHPSLVFAEGPSPTDGAVIMKAQDNACHRVQLSKTPSCNMHAHICSNQ